MTDNMKRVLEKAIKHYGKSNQVTKCIEEVGELLQAVGKYLTFASTFNRQQKSKKELPLTEGMKLNTDFLQAEQHLQEEIADAIIMLQQMRLMFGPHHVDWWIDHKLERLNDRIEKEKKSV